MPRIVLVQSLKAFHYENKELQLPIQFKVFSIEFAGLRNKLENTIDIADKHLVKVKEIFENERVKDLSEQPIKANAVDGTRSTVNDAFNQPYRRNTNAFSKYEEALISSSVSAEVIAKKLAQIADHVRQFVFKHEKPAEMAEKDVLLAAHPSLFKSQDKIPSQHTYGEALLKILDQEITNYMQKSESLNLDLQHLGSKKVNLISNEVEKALSKLTKDSHINGQPNIPTKVNVLKLQT
ncbi:hypothetical protein CCR75_002596 [Bremia lactucae]|uniref:Uncharacterized protein n=1 Tax=Bremia lactucae TaxID=4779 RepID=A0A976ILT3_BRELC|nr:hypothetical protein CCR75_002596 [Bremia lactucae]